MNPNEPIDEDIELVSKTKLKQDAADLVDLGKAIAALSASQLEAMQLDEELSAAIHQVRKLTRGPALKRQFKYIGKLLRDRDAEPLRSALSRQLEQDRFATARLHQLEQWRDRLISEGDSALSEFLNEYPQADRQHLRQLIRQAAAEQAANKPPAAARKLFKYLRGLIEQTAE